ncbi:hypothetical protein SPAR_03626 [Streptomyces sparsogenes DSM 40356]|uniref:Uncharacterized protein n=1 Tax=Streptomyces sparsogenes DSM 40356 TaxID=1331668 RepID=A0A1R1SRL0_9ACTN|nr:hypothetical protein SPAR_03626 [Streptomyces sparsogenes DSM 40356]
MWAPAPAPVAVVIQATGVWSSGARGRRFSGPPLGATARGRSGGSGIMGVMTTQSPAPWITVAVYENLPGRPHPQAATRA